MFETVLITWKVVVSWWALAHEIEHVLEYTFWISNNLDMKLRQLIYIYIYIYKMCMVLRAGSWIQVFSNLSTYHNLTKKKKKNYDEIIVFYFFESVHWDDQKMSKSKKKPKSTIAGYIMLLFYQSQKRVWN